MDKIPIELCQIILDQLDFRTQFKFRRLNKIFYSTLHIHNLYIDEYKYYCFFTGEILRPHAFVKRLFLHSNPFVTDLNYMINLEELYINHAKRITDKSIAQLNLIILKANNCSGITNLNHMTRLRHLEISYCPGITDINRLTNLRVLFADDDCGVDDAGLANLVNLRELSADNNSKITSVVHMTQLCTLRAQYASGITDAGIPRSVKYLQSSWNQKITFRRNI